MDIWEAESLEKVMGGRTRPLVLRCSKTTSASDAYAEFDELDSQALPEGRVMVVKSLGHPEITQTSLFCELFGNLLAREIGIDTPEPGLVNISHALANALNPLLTGHGIRLKAGLGVGTEQFKGGFASPVPDADLGADEVGPAALIYAFDLMCQNPDRTTPRPNCAFLGKRLIAFDFEMTFSFIYAVGKKDEPWRVSSHGIGENHVFRRFLKRHNFDWSLVIASIGTINSERIDELVNEVPAGWRRHSGKVKRHLQAVLTNLEQLELELQRSLL